jgi:hypothetical protein
VLDIHSLIPTLENSKIMQEAFDADEKEDKFKSPRTHNFILRAAR